MKKLISLAVAVLMLTVLSVPAFAIDFDPDPVNSRDHNGNPDTVPMYGYVGPVVDELVDPDPDDPTVNPWKLNISVPVKFIWAAFQPDESAVDPLKADVESPKYNIINSGDKDVKISIVDFIEESALNKGEVELNFESVSGVTFDETLVPNDGVNPFTAIDLGTIDAKSGATDTKWTFVISGEYDAASEGAWPDEVQLPVYTVVFKFKVA